MLYCAESDSAHIRKNEFFSETILDSLSVTQMGLIHEKKLKKSRGTASPMEIIRKKTKIGINVDDKQKKVQN